MADEIEPTAAKAKAAGVGFWTRDRLRGWLKEYVIIVVGVLTALAGQEAVEAANWKSKVADAERDLKVELASNAVFAYERLVTVRCATGTSMTRKPFSEILELCNAGVLRHRLRLLEEARLAIGTVAGRMSGAA